MIRQRYTPLKFMLTTAYKFNKAVTCIFLLWEVAANRIEWRRICKFCKCSAIAYLYQTQTKSVKTFTENSYPYKHWLASLALGSLVGLASSIEMYLVYLMMGVIFSLPAFVVYLIAFGLLSKNAFSPFILKVILNLLAVAGVVITLTVIGGDFAVITAMIYSGALVITSFFFRIEQTPATTN
jgi:hypothetical protein